MSAFKPPFVPAQEAEVANFYPVQPEEVAGNSPVRFLEKKRDEGVCCIEAVSEVVWLKCKVGRSAI